MLRDTVELDGRSPVSGSPLCGIKVVSIVFISHHRWLNIQLPLHAQIKSFQLHCYSSWKWLFNLNDLNSKAQDRNWRDGTEDSLTWYSRKSAKWTERLETNLEIPYKRVKRTLCAIHVCKQNKHAHTNLIHFTLSISEKRHTHSLLMVSLHREQIFGAC